MVKLPPLSLYIHIPWCVTNARTGDFNSHALKGEVPHDDYVQHLLNHSGQRCGLRSEP